MGHTTRQFTALSKKNFISYFRQPGCAVFQLLCPGLLMFILVWIRTKITATTPPEIDYEIYKKPFYPAFEYEGGNLWSTSDFQVSSARQDNFFIYDNYNLNNQSSYSIVSDMNGPLHFLPTNCLEKNSVVIPRVESPVIAVVGPSNSVQDALTAYLEQLIQVQELIDPGASPNYVFKNYATLDEFNSYVAN
jgi:hypothetical protein